MKALVKDGIVLKNYATKKDASFVDALGNPTTGSLGNSPTIAEYESVGLYEVALTTRPVGDKVIEVMPTIVAGYPEQQWQVDTFTAEELTAYLSAERTRLRIEIRNLVVGRCGARIEALGNLVAIDLMVELWPMLNAGSATVDITACKDIYLYGKNKIAELTSATRVQIDAYDPTTDLSFPT